MKKQSKDLKNIETKMNTNEFLNQLEQLQSDALETAKLKNADYAGLDNPFKNFELVETLGICSVEKGILVRMCDKMSRISTLLNKDASVEDEKITDTLQDLSNYSLILRVYLEQKNDN